MNLNDYIILFNKCKFKLKMSAVACSSKFQTVQYYLKFIIIILLYSFLRNNALMNVLNYNNAMTFEIINNTYFLLYFV